MISKSTRKIGNSGEEIATKFLKGMGYRILKRNYFIRGGEIDVIALDKETLVFVEVKLRKNDAFGLATESITYFKMKALLRAAQYYLATVRWGDRPYRFDLVAIDFVESKAKIELVKNIFN